MNELTRWGYNDDAYRLLLNEKMPSWLYPIERGATTIWERWDGYVEGRGFQDPGMNSFAHYALGSVGEWVWRTVVGINSDESSPGFSHFVIHPQPSGGLTWAKGEYDSICGTIKVQWRIENGQFLLDLTIPPNTEATVIMPVGKGDTIREGDRTASAAPGVRSIKDSAVFRVSSGNYRFAAPWRN